MNASYSITAYFDWWYPEAVAQLTVSSTSGGSVTEPGEGAFLCSLGEQVPLIAEPDEGHAFLRWTGDVGTIGNVTAASTTITMDMPYDITAEFSGGGFCFIATAAYGTPMAEEIQVLRQFRDEYLLASPLGATLVEFYYAVSPPLAQFITEHPGLKPIARAALVPAVAVSAIAVNTSPVENGVVMAVVGLVLAAVATWATRRRAKARASLKAN
jgi:hypothetical protein